MADVVLIHAAEDADRVGRLREALAAAGYAPPADAASPEDEGPARSVACWSAASTTSAAVLEQARAALDGGRLIGVRLEPCSPPAPFDEDVLDLSGWTGDADDPAFKALLVHLQSPVMGMIRTMRRWRPNELAPDPTEAAPVAPDVAAPILDSPAADAPAAAAVAPAPPPWRALAPWLMAAAALLIAIVIYGDVANRLEATEQALAARARELATVQASRDAAATAADQARAALSAEQAARRTAEAARQAAQTRLDDAQAASRTLAAQLQAAAAETAARTAEAAKALDASERVVQTLRATLEKAQADAAASARKAAEDLAAATRRGDDLDRALKAERDEAARAGAEIARLNRALDDARRSPPAPQDPRPTQ